jgi:putative transposase
MDRRPGRATLGQIVAFFKYRSSKAINALCGTPGAPVWQRNYYERTVRGDAELELIRRYIRQNPTRWEEERERGWEEPSRFMLTCRGSKTCDK